MKAPPPLQNKNLPRVYMAGKVGRRNYRNELGLGSRGMSQINHVNQHKERSYIYNGPIIPSCDHGCWHDFFDGGTGSDGGFIKEEKTSFFVEPTNHEAVVGSTMKQIQSSDFLFAWFESYDAYGSIAEIGFAAGMGIPVYIGFREDVFPIQESSREYSWYDHKARLVGRELWYIATIAHRSFLSSTPSDAFTRALRYHAKGTATPSWRSMLDSHFRFVFPGKQYKR